MRKLLRLFRSNITRLNITQFGEDNYSYITVDQARSCADCDLYGNSNNWPYEGWLRITKEAYKVFLGKTKVDKIDGTRIYYGWITKEI